MDGSRTTHMDDDGPAVLPTGAVPVVDALPVEDRDSVFDLGAMEAKFSEYKEKAPTLQALHTAWLDTYKTWDKRVDMVFGKVDQIETSVAAMLGAEPGSNYEPFEILSLPTGAQGIAAMIGIGQSAYGLHKARQAHNAAKAATDSMAAKSLKWSRLSVFAAGAGLLFSGYVAFRTVSDRTRFLIDSLPELAEWFSNGGEQIAAMKAVTENELIQSIRDIAVILGVDDPDNNVMYHNVVARLNAAMTDAAEVEAQYKVATRMLCPIPGRAPESYSVTDTATATGLPQTVVQTRADEIAADAATICKPYLPGD